MKILIPLLLVTQLIYAKKFSNDFIEFNIPGSWKCLSDGQDWYCSPENESRQKEAIIIFTAKKRDEKDTLNKYFAHLNKTKSFSMPNGKNMSSDKKFTRRQKFNDQLWVDSLHLASEVPGYYTRYLATVKEDIGVAVTFSVVRNKYNEYKDLFESIIKSMRLLRAGTSSQNNFALNTLTQDGEGAELLDISVSKQIQDRAQKTKNTGSVLFFFILAISIGGAVFFIRKRQMRSKKSEKNQQKVDKNKQNVA